MNRSAWVAGVVALFLFASGRITLAGALCFTGQTRSVDIGGLAGPESFVEATSADGFGPFDIDLVDAAQYQETAHGSEPEVACMSDASASQHSSILTHGLIAAGGVTASADSSRPDTFESAAWATSYLEVGFLLSAATPYHLQGYVSAVAPGEAQLSLVRSNGTTLFDADGHLAQGPLGGDFDVRDVLQPGTYTLSCGSHVVAIAVPGVAGGILGETSGDGAYSFTFTVAPEPSTLLLLSMAAAALLIGVWRGRR